MILSSRLILISVVVAILGVALGAGLYWFTSSRLRDPGENSLTQRNELGRHYVCGDRQIYDFQITIRRILNDDKGIVEIVQYTTRYSGDNLQFALIRSGGSGSGNDFEQLRLVDGVQYTRVGENAWESLNSKDRVINPNWARKIELCPSAHDWIYLGEERLFGVLVRHYTGYDLRSALLVVGEGHELVSEPSEYWVDDSGLLVKRRDKDMLLFQQNGELYKSAVEEKLYFGHGDNNIIEKPSNIVSE